MIYNKKKYITLFILEEPDSLVPATHLERHLIVQSLQKITLFGCKTNEFGGNDTTCEAIFFKTF